MEEPKLLIVEDEFLNRRLLVDYLRKYGPCRQAGNGQEALREVVEAYEGGRPFDMVFLDLVMPTMDGLQFLAEVRRLEGLRGVPTGSGIKIVVTSAMNDKKSIEAAETYDAVEYIVKPFRREAVEACMKKYFGQP